MIDYSLAYCATRKLIQNNRVVLSLSLYVYLEEGCAGRRGGRDEVHSLVTLTIHLKKMNFLLS